MKHFKYIIFAALMGMLNLLMVSCNSATKEKRPQPYERQILAAQERVKNEPQNSRLIGDLGILYYRAGQYEKAILLLQKSHEIDIADPRSIAFLGLSYEATHNYPQAFSTFEKYTQVSRKSPYYSWLKGRYGLSRRKAATAYINLRLQADQAIGDNVVNYKRVLIQPFAYHGNDSKYRGIGTAICQLLVEDFSEIANISVIDREQIEAFERSLDENAATGNLDKSALVAGKFFAARHVLRGAYNILNESQLILDYSVWDLTSTDIPSTRTHAENLDNLYRLYRQMRDDLLKSLPSAVSKKDYAKILEQPAPTQNIQALIQYSLGLIQEDAGRYKEAIERYNQALALDENFSACLKRLRWVELYQVALKDPREIDENLGIAEKYSL